MREVSKQETAVTLLQIILSIALLGAATPSAAALENRAQASACVFPEVSSQSCPCVSQVRYVEIQAIDGKTVLITDGQVRPFELAADAVNAARIQNELENLVGARYDLPRSQADLLSALGFPMSAIDTLQDSDWLETLQIHVEMMLAVSAETSEFLLAQMGVGYAHPIEDEIAGEAADSAAIAPVRGRSAFVPVAVEETAPTPIVTEQPAAVVAPPTTDTTNVPPTVP